MGRVVFVCEGLNIRKSLRILRIYAHYRGDNDVLCGRVIEFMKKKYEFDEGDETIQGHYWHLVIIKHYAKRELEKMFVYAKEDVNGGNKKI
jgi:hypothetical protein